MNFFKDKFVIAIQSTSIHLVTFSVTCMPCGDRCGRPGLSSHRCPSIQIAFWKMKSPNIITYRMGDKSQEHPSSQNYLPASSYLQIPPNCQKILCLATNNLLNCSTLDVLLQVYQSLHWSEYHHLQNCDQWVVAASPKRVCEGVISLTSCSLKNKISAFGISSQV